MGKKRKKKKKKFYKPTVRLNAKPTVVHKNKGKKREKARVQKLLAEGRWDEL